MSSKEQELVSLSGSFEWVLTDVKTKLVDRFPEVKKDLNIKVKSPPFHCAGHQWQLLLLMVRKADNSSVSTGVFLRTFLEDHQVECGAEIWNNKTVVIGWSKQMVSSNSWGMNDVWTEQELKKIAADKNEIVLSVKITAKSDPFQDNQKEKDIVSKPVLKFLPFDEKFSDITIKTIDNIKFKAHKVVLAYRSPVFAAMFTYEMKESKDGFIEV